MNLETKSGTDSSSQTESDSHTDSESETESDSDDELSLSDILEAATNCDFEKKFFQKFSIPFSIVYYMCKNPSSPAVYKKLIQTCKHFFAVNPIIYVNDLRFFYDGRITVFYYADIRNESKDFPDIADLQISCKFWIQKAVFDTLTNLHLLCDKVCGIKTLVLTFDTVVLDQLLHPEVIRNIEKVEFLKTIPRHADGTPLLIEEIMDLFPRLRSFEMCGQSRDPSVNEQAFTTETAKKIVNAPFFKNLKKFHFDVLSERFDFQLFAEVMRKQPETDFWLRFQFNPSKEYKAQLQAFIDETIESYRGEYLPRMISFPGSLRYVNLYTNRSDFLRNLAYARAAKARAEENAAKLASTSNSSIFTY